jgi:hypothetical protein
VAKETPEEKRIRIRKFLMECSGTELADFLMARHAGAANARRTMRDALDTCIAEIADARLAAEVAIIREELKHASVLPFPKKVDESPTHPETPPRQTALQHGNHRWGNSDTQRGQETRHLLKR